ncbi:hypothetical protein ES703_123875 [subsurface metagenome]
MIVLLEQSGYLRDLIESQKRVHPWEAAYKLSRFSLGQASCHKKRLDLASSAPLLLPLYHLGRFLNRFF